MSAPAKLNWACNVRFAKALEEILVHIFYFIFAREPTKRPTNGREYVFVISSTTWKPMAQRSSSKIRTNGSIFLTRKVTQGMSAGFAFKITPATVRWSQFRHSSAWIATISLGLPSIYRDALSLNDVISEHALATSQSEQLLGLVTICIFFMICFGQQFLCWKNAVLRMTV